MDINKAALAFLTAFGLVAAGIATIQYLNPGPNGERRELIIDYPAGTRPDASLQCLGCTARGPSAAWTAFGLDMADGGVALAWAETSFDPNATDPGKLDLPVGIETTGCVTRPCDPDPPLVHVWRSDVAPWLCSCPSARDGHPIPIPCVVWGERNIAPPECCEGECAASDGQPAKICNVGACGNSCGECPSGLWCRGGTECVEPCLMDESRCPRDAGTVEVPPAPDLPYTPGDLFPSGTSTP